MQLPYVTICDDTLQNIHNFRTDWESFSTFVLRPQPRAGGKMRSPPTIKRRIMMKFNKIILILLLVLAVSAISLMPSFAHHSLAFSSREIQTISTYGPVLTATPLPNFGWKPTKTHQDAPPQEAVASGPDQFAKGINPLTGLPVTDPDLLAYPPALISVSNFPVSARPQAGLSFSPTVFELFIGEGMTRFLALFYGEYPQVNAQNGDASVITNN